MRLKSIKLLIMLSFLLSPAPNAGNKTTVDQKLTKRR